MAGSLKHIIEEDGTFVMDSIENLGDAYEALHECFHVILDLADGDMDRITAICKRRRYPDPFGGLSPSASMKETPDDD